MQSGEIIAVDHVLRTGGGLEEILIGIKKDFELNTTMQNILKEIAGDPDKQAGFMDEMSKAEGEYRQVYQEFRGAKWAVVGEEEKMDLLERLRSTAENLVSPFLKNYQKNIQILSQGTTPVLEQYKRTLNSGVNKTGMLLINAKSGIDLIEDVTERLLLLVNYVKDPLGTFIVEHNEKIEKTVKSAIESIGPKSRKKEDLGSIDYLSQDLRLEEKYPGIKGIIAESDSAKREAMKQAYVNMKKTETNYSAGFMSARMWRLYALDIYELNKLNQKVIGAVREFWNIKMIILLRQKKDFWESMDCATSNAAELGTLHKDVDIRMGTLYYSEIIKVSKMFKKHGKRYHQQLVGGPREVRIAIADFVDNVNSLIARTQGLEKFMQFKRKV